MHDKPFRCDKQIANRPRSIYQYSNMAPRLSGQNSIFGVVFFVSKSLLGVERQKKLEKFAILTRKPRSHARILIYRTWPIVVILKTPCFTCCCVVIFRCKLRVVDSFGTEAQFNFNQYKEKVGGGSMGAFGRYNLNLRQFQTMFRKMYSFMFS